MTKINIDKAVVYASVQVPYDPTLKIDKATVYAAVQVDTKGNLYQGTAGNRPVFTVSDVRYIDFTGGKSFQFASLSAEQFNWLILKTDGLFEEGSFTAVVGLNTITVPNFCQMVLFPASYSYTNIYKEALKATMKARTPIFYTGGTVTQYLDGSTLYRVHTFTGDGTLIAPTNRSISYLVVAGGGAGGVRHAGGGGGGGLLTGSTTLTAGSYPIVVGTGGIASTSEGVNSAPGNNSTFNGLTALGGGRGGNNAQAGGPGGSGGGGSNNGGSGAGTVGQGNNGGTGGPTAGQAIGGGGGGAGSAGANAASPNSGAGGNGLSSSITGTAVVYAGGGGGGASVGLTNRGLGGTGGGGNGSPNTTTADSGVNGLGGGGGGGGANGASSGFGGNGGSGVVIIRYAI